MHCLSLEHCAGRSGVSLEDVLFVPRCSAQNMTPIATTTAAMVSSVAFDTDVVLSDTCPDVAIVLYPLA